MSTRPTREAVAASIVIVVVAVAIGVIMVVVGSLVENHYALGAALCGLPGAPAGACGVYVTMVTLGQVLQGLGWAVMLGGAGIGVLSVIAPWKKKRNAIAGSATGRIVDTTARRGTSTAGRTPVTASAYNRRPQSFVVSRDWQEVMAAAATMPEPRSVELRRAIAQASSSQRPFSAWFFAPDAKDENSLVVVFVDRILIASCATRGTELVYGDTQPVLVEALRGSDGMIVKLTVSGHEFHDPQPPEAAANFVAVGTGLPWIRVIIASEPETVASELKTVASEPPDLARPPASLGATVATDTPEPSEVQPGVLASAPVSFVADELTKLAKLKEDGVLTEEEFVAQKGKLLS